MSEAKISSGTPVVYKGEKTVVLASTKDYVSGQISYKLGPPTKAVVDEATLVKENEGLLEEKFAKHDASLRAERAKVSLVGVLGNHATEAERSSLLIRGEVDAICALASEAKKAESEAELTAIVDAALAEREDKITSLLGMVQNTVKAIGAKNVEALVNSQPVDQHVTKATEAIARIQSAGEEAQREIERKMTAISDIDAANEAIKEHKAADEATEGAEEVKETTEDVEEVTAPAVTLDELRAEYKELYGKNVRTDEWTNREWIADKIAEAKRNAILALDHEGLCLMVLEKGIADVSPGSYSADQTEAFALAVILALEL